MLRPFAGELEDACRAEPRTDQCWGLLAGPMRCHLDSGSDIVGTRRDRGVFVGTAALPLTGILKPENGKAPLRKRASEEHVRAVTPGAFFAVGGAQHHGSSLSAGRMMEHAAKLRVRRAELQRLLLRLSR